MTEEIELDLTKPEEFRSFFQGLVGHRITGCHDAGENVLLTTRGPSSDLSIYLPVPKKAQVERKTLAMELSISKTTSNWREGVVHIQIQDVLSSVQVISAEVGLEDFARALFGQGCIPCSVEVVLGAPVGKQRENKSALVPIPQRVVHVGLEAIAAALAAVAPFEVDGWQAIRPLDVFNGHCRVQIGDDGPQARIGFERWVEIEDE